MKKDLYPRQLANWAHEFVCGLPRSIGRFVLQSANVFESLTGGVATSRVCENLGVPTSTAEYIGAVVTLGALTINALIINAEMHRQADPQPHEDQLCSPHMSCPSDEVRDKFPEIVISE